MPRTLTLMMTAVLALAGGSVTLTGNPPAAIAADKREAAEADAIFRFAIETAEKTVLGKFRPTCAGIFLKPGLGMTAAHCLKGTEHSILVECRSPGGEQSLKMVRVTAHVQHPTHDVTLLALGPLDCSTGPTAIAAQINAQDELLVLPPFAKKPASSPYRIRWAEADVGPHTVDIVSDTLCLSAGDSGTPLFVETRQPIRPVAGLLIAGMDSCPGELTFVRLDGIRDWIEAFRAETKQ